MQCIHIDSKQNGVDSLSNILYDCAIYLRPTRKTLHELRRTPHARYAPAGLELPERGLEPDAVEVAVPRDLVHGGGRARAGGHVVGVVRDLGGRTGRSVSMECTLNTSQTHEAGGERY